MNKCWTYAGLVALATSLPAFADIKLTENLSVSGYATGSAYTSKYDGSDRESGLELDSAKLAFTGTFEKVTGKVSLHTFTDTEIKLLDAYATYDFGGGTSLTVGKFLSYLGFEAFDYPNMLQISYANALSGFIPAYHSGVKADFSSGNFSGGLAVLDSVYGPTAYRGDQDLENGVGFEGFFKYGTDATSALVGLAYDTSGPNDIFTADFWLQHVIGDTTLAAEFCHSTMDLPGGGSLKGHFWLVLAMQSFGKWSVTARVSGGKDDIYSPDAKFTRYTISPAVTLTDNLGFLFEYSHTKFKNIGVDDGNFLAGQFVFKF